MPAFHPDQRTPALKQTHRRRSAYQSLTSMSPLDFLHLHRERFQSTRVHKNAENGNPASIRAPPRAGTRLGFSIRRRRENANRPIIHQAKMVIREDEHVDVAAADGLPPYEESKARCSKLNDADDPISPTTIVPTITITPSTGHDDTANSPSSSTGPAVKVESKPTVTNESKEQPATEPTKPPGKPLSMPFYSGGGECYSCADRMIQPEDVNWHYNRTRSPHSFNNFLHPTHCPRLSGQCCKCGARGRCRHFNAAWSMPQAFISGTMRSGRYRHNHGGDIMDVGAGHASSSFDDWADTFIRCADDSARCEREDDKAARGGA
ncbi:hypothetical protein H072_2177 [Dactylellina haptotyla CBS 200.50]|uniref:Uncharacterized protein n=1 Tax=Dactylellina haptotyla (strain CBS 200.50) TaxID=1284197 RepID=S8C8B6_DACHA|nr:hypothetical protein H072_2177 [Dactylellina haptotyla CBS 200.50]